MNKNLKTAFATLALVAVAGLAACNNDKTETATTTAPVAQAGKPKNTTCPFTGGKVNPAVTSTMHDTTIGFCCAGCKGKFDAMGHDAQHAMMDKAK